MVMGIMKSIVPISRFNKGEANRIFEEVESSGTKIVMKNNRPACILMSPEQYESLMEMVPDYLLQEEADRIYSIDDVFTPIKDGEIMPSDRYTEIYMEGGGKVLMGLIWNGRLRSCICQSLFRGWRPPEDREDSPPGGRYH